MDILEKDIEVCRKPDTYFVNEGEPFTLKKDSHHMLIGSPYWLRQRPTQQAADSFAKRSGFKFSDSEDIYDGLRRYLLEMDNKAVLFNSIYKFGFFSSIKSPDLVILVRHPYAAYLSYAKPERHKNLADQMDGIKGDKFISYFCNSWNCLVNEYLKCKEFGAKSLRYEYLEQDAVGISILDRVRRNWKPQIRNIDCQSKEAVKIRKLTSNFYDEIYSQWDINRF